MPKLNPVVVTERTLGDAAFDGIRIRPAVAINAEGKLVVCSKRTARKHGWEIQGVLHQRPTKAARKVAKATPAEGTAPIAVKPAQRKDDPKNAVVVSGNGVGSGSLLELAGLLAPKGKKAKAAA